MSLETANLTHPERMFGVPVAPLADAVNYGSALFTRNDTEPGASTAYEAGDVVLAIAGVYPYMVDVRRTNGAPVSDPGGLERAMATVRSVGYAFLGPETGSDAAADTAEAVPSMLSPMKQVIRTVLDSSVTAETFPGLVLAALDHPDNQAAARQFVTEYKRLFGRFDSASGELSREIDELYKRAVAGGGKSISSGHVANNLVTVTDELLSGGETSLPLLGEVASRGLTGYIKHAKGMTADVARKALRAKIDSAKFKAGIPDVLAELEGILADGTNTKRARTSGLRKLGDTFASKKTALALAGVSNIGPLLTSVLEVVPADRDEVRATTESVRELFALQG